MNRLAPINKNNNENVIHFISETETRKPFFRNIHTFSETPLTFPKTGHSCLQMPCSCWADLQPPTNADHDAIALHSAIGDSGGVTTLSDTLHLANKILISIAMNPPRVRLLRLIIPQVGQHVRLRNPAIQSSGRLNARVDKPVQTHMINVSRNLGSKSKENS